MVLEQKYAKAWYLFDTLSEKKLSQFIAQIIDFISSNVKL